ncbi:MULTISPECIES: prolyl oligopeptidase family serine peptidase [Pseudoxanthomonas]|uniref:Dienelactone hydrolase n=1 Tax=Pseudoxanthomonas winnipegensis TaxID=2480810 RepID=A0AAW8GDE6_9GAMM|nr:MULTISPECIES: prolyl oligopeptidase family serine peptidase [Pseudoxanthomonas]MDQ1120475.1 dienelactone hydrolase [Pseudoxanthomonas winnipegensis]MDQ1133694.1 dienelactone hydrolase [Pseudoxanthomonas winnipegensis]MDR6140065.1 dienelactone hydrolase [Pseudoxanthomonas sp. SORGH_AS_0997]
MFKYFPTNYVWNLSVDLSIEMGARMGEIEAMCAPLQQAAQAPDAAGTEAFRQTWIDMADTLLGLAGEDEARGRLLSAGDKLIRASNYMLTAERMLAHGSEGRVELYQRFLASFAEGLRLSGSSCRRVEIPYEGTHLSALYVPAEGVVGPQPVLVQVNGLDSTKEMKFLVGLPGWLAKRGVASLIVDQPGTGEALRLHDLKARFDSEHWASRVVDWLETQEAIDSRRIGLEGVSLGGYYCPRAVAFEPRFACGVVWGANHDWRDVQKRRLAKEGQFPVPHYWSHVMWVWGARDMDHFMEIAEQVHLDGVLDRIRVPFLVTHGEKDSQIPLHWAHVTYAQLVNSPKRELKIFDARTGGVQHSSFDNSANAGAYIADWVAETLGGRTARAGAP